MLRNLLAVVSLLLLAACSATVPTQDTAQPAAPDIFGALPVDKLQPWEKDAAHRSSAVSPQSSFTPGVERFSEVGTVTDDGEASVVVAGSKSLSGGIYRISMAGTQPAALVVDANLLEVGGVKSQYWVGVSDYGRGHWELHGPFSEAQVTLTLDKAADYLSPLGNTFITITAYDNAELQIVGLTVSPRDSADTTAPPVPTAPSVTAVDGGLELAWTDVIAADLAGYRVYWSYSPFTATSDNGVNSVPWLENTTRLVLPIPLTRIVYLALSAVDTNGNASGLSPVVTAKTIGVRVLNVIHIASPLASARRDDPVEITASGNELYDFDTDGDGDFEITDSADGTASVDTSATGIIRPRVRGHSTDGKAVAFGSVSLVVTGNQRPVASAECNPQSGVAPLHVNFSGTAEDFDGTIADYAWDFDMDGTYDVTTLDTDHDFSAPGLYNVKLRVTDDLGAWDVDTIGILVTELDVPGPVQINAVPNYAEPGQQITLTATPPAGGALGYEWDLDGDGSFETDTGGSNSVATAFSRPGDYSIGVLVDVPDSPLAVGTTQVRIKGWRIAVPGLEPTPGVGADTSSIALVGGVPAQTYPDYLNFDVKYVRALDAAGTAWSAPVTVDPLGGTWESMRVVNGRPAISYNGATDSNLYYVRATNATGSAWGAPVEVGPSADSLGTQSQLLIVNGRPAIVSASTSLNRVKFVRANDPDGTTWGAPVIVDNSSNWEGFGLGAAIVSGNPAVMYRTTSGLLYVRASDPDGATWGMPTSIYFAPSIQYPSMAVVAGKPAVCYSLNNYLYYQPASDSLGADWSGAIFTVAVEPTGNIFYWSTLRVINGVPCIATSRGSIDCRTFVRAANANGSVWGPVTPVEHTGGYTDLQDFNGQPAMCYGLGLASGESSVGPNFALQY